MKQPLIIKGIRNRDFRSLDQYLSEVHKIKLISAQEEADLSRRVKDGDQSALHRLTKANLRFVIAVAKQYQHHGLTLGDLINEGNIGLITAARKFDHTKGFRFISYAIWWIRQAILKAIADHARIVRLPYSQILLLSRLDKACICLEHIHDRKPTTDELSEFMKIPAGDIKELFQREVRAVPIDEPFTDNNDYRLIDILQQDVSASNKQADKDAVKWEINYSFRVLKTREREILNLYFGIGSFSALPLEEIGKRFNITKAQTCRLKEGALQKIRNSTGVRVLDSCFC